MINIFLKNVNTGDIFELPYSSITVVEELNVGREARFSFDFRSVKDIADRYMTTVEFILTGGLREISVEKNGTKMYLGVISDFTISKDTKGTLKIEVASVGYFSLLAKRRTSQKRIFSNADAGQIAWTLINESQTADPPFSSFGIIQGSIQSSVNRDRTFRFANLKQEITQLSNNNLKNGFDFDIDNNKFFNVFYPQKGSNRNNIIFDESNILSWGLRKPLILSLTNKVYVLGEGFNDDVLFVTRVSADDYKTNFKVLEDVLADRNIQTTDTLDDKGDKFLSDNQSPILGLSITHFDDQPDVLHYEVGDSLKLWIEDLGLENVFKRVMRRTIKIDSNEGIIIALDMK